MPDRRQINQDGLNIIKGREGLRLKRYQACPGDPWSIGYGHVIQPDEAFPETISEAQALSLLVGDMGTAAEAVERLVKVPLNDNQFGALVSFTYNEGQGNLGASTLLKLLNQGDYQGAADEFPKWRKAGGQVLEGLVSRRADERELFLTPMQSNEAAQECPAAVPFQAKKEEPTMNYLLMGPLLSMAIKLACKMLPMLLDKVHPGLATTLSTEVSPGMKELIQKGLVVAQTFAESTETNLDNYLVQGAQAVAGSLGLLPASLAPAQTDTPS